MTRHYYLTACELSGSGFSDISIMEFPVSGVWFPDSDILLNTFFRRRRDERPDISLSRANKVST